MLGSRCWLRRVRGGREYAPVAELRPRAGARMASKSREGTRAVYDGDISSELISEQQISDKVAELAARITEDYRDAQGDLVLVGVLKGAVLFMTDFARALPRPAQLEFMAVSSYGSSTSSSGVVRILKDLDRDIANQHVLVLEDIIDSGLTLSWLLKNLDARNP